VYRWSRSTAPRIQISAPDGGEWSTENIGTTYRVGQVVWVLSTREKSVDSACNRTPDHPARSLVTILTELPLHIWVRMAQLKTTWFSKRTSIYLHNSAVYDSVSRRTWPISHSTRPVEYRFGINMRIAGQKRADALRDCRLPPRSQWELALQGRYAALIVLTITTKGILLGLLDPWIWDCQVIPKRR